MNRRLNPHLDHAELLSRIYGISEDHADKHLHDCAECAARLAEFERRRAGAAPLPEVSSEFLAGQRRAIYARLDERPRGSLRWTPALVAVFLLAVGIFLYEPQARAPRPASAPHAEQNDDQFFADLYSIEQTLEPQAAAPIHALFETVEEGQ